MPYLNNIYGNAAFVGCFSGMLHGKSIKSATSADYSAARAAAAAMAVDIDALIAFDALVTTGASITQLDPTTNTIAANEQWRAGLLQQICYAVHAGKYTESAAVAGGQTALAAAIFAAWTQALTSLVTP
jgi:hypothetical protein